MCGLGEALSALGVARPFKRRLESCFCQECKQAKESLVLVVVTIATAVKG